MWEFLRSKPKCPIDPEQQQWIDGRFHWLQEQFGAETSSKARMILPTPEFFPDAYDGREEDAQAMLARVAGYMNVDASRLDLFIYSEANPMALTGADGRSQGSAGLYMGRATEADRQARTSIGIEESQLGDPMALVATLAHELGHEILLGQGRVSADEEDHEPLTDLLTVFLGLGIFTANSTIYDKGWSSGTRAGWQTRRLGYLDQRMFAYALARFAMEREDSPAEWSRHLRLDVREPMGQALRFLASTR